MVEFIEKGIDLIFGKDDCCFFVMLDIFMEIIQLERQQFLKEEFQVQKDVFICDYSIKLECIYFVSQLLKVYMFFEIENEYVIIDGKVKIVDELIGCIMEGCCYFDGLYQVIEVKENVIVEVVI